MCSRTWMGLNNKILSRINEVIVNNLLALRAEMHTSVQHGFVTGLCLSITNVRKTLIMLLMLEKKKKKKKRKRDGHLDLGGG